MISSSELVVEFDDLMRCCNFMLSNTCEKEFLRYVQLQKGIFKGYCEAIDEVKRLKIALDAANKDVSTLDSKLASARRWLDSERRQRKKYEDSLYSLLDELHRIVAADPRNTLSDDAKEKITTIRRNALGSNNMYRDHYGQFNPSNGNVTEELDLTSDISISRSEDDLDESCSRQVYRKHRASCVDEEPVSVKRNKLSSAILHTPSASAAESVESLETCGEEATKCVLILNGLNERTHSFVSRTLIMPEYCLQCEKKILFGHAFRCTECNTVVHPECRYTVPIPCMPVKTLLKSGTAAISEYVPMVPPLIPAIVVHCANEVERRGLNEVGIYGIPAIEKEFRSLKEKFWKCKGVPNLTNVDIHTVCCCLKDFLRGLHDSLIPSTEWNVFADAVSEGDSNKLREAVGKLPQANRDTLVFVVLHLQKVAASGACKMSISKLATVFGPAIVGYSSNVQADPSAEVEMANRIMEELLRLEYVTVNSAPYAVMCKTPNEVRNTPGYFRGDSAKKPLATPNTRKRFFHN